MRLLLFLFINFFASAFQGVVGFGQALIATPLALTFLSKGSALSGMLVAGTTLCFFLSRRVKEPLNMSIFTPLLIGSLLGMPVGLIILKLLPIATLRIVVGIASVVFMIALLCIKAKQPYRLRFLTPLVGFICGVLQTSAGMPGAPAVLLLSGAGISKNSMRKILATFFLSLSVITWPFYILGKVLTLQGLVFGLCAVPVVLIAGYIGNKIANRIPGRWYKRIALVTVGLTGVFTIYSGVR